MNKLNTKFLKGFSIVEVVLYSGLLIIFLTIISQLFLTSLDSQLDTKSTTSLQADAEYIKSRISYDLLRAESVTEPSTLGETGGDLVLVLNSGQTHTYSLSGSDLILTDSSGSYRLNSTDTDVSNLNFIRLGNNITSPIIQVIMTIDSSVNTVSSSNQIELNYVQGTRL